MIAQINPQMPRVHGDAFIPLVGSIMLLKSISLPEMPRRVLTETEYKIGHHVASLIENGSTLQMGIGSIPDAVLSALTHHRNLGIHTEMWSDGALDLILSGVVDNSKKSVHHGKTISTFIMGTKRVYQFIHDNPSLFNIKVVCQCPEYNRQESKSDCHQFCS